MREIKFRGKRADKDKWIYGDLLSHTELFSEYEISDCNTIDGSRYDVDEETIGQYTGLHDKNGKEIYEGDIVKFSDIGEEGYEYKEGFDFENMAEVIYEKGIYTLDNFAEWDNSYYATDCGDEGILEEILRHGNCEVIGNIYDNPELLEV